MTPPPESLPSSPTTHFICVHTHVIVLPTTPVLKETRRTTSGRDRDSSSSRSAASSPLFHGRGHGALRLGWVRWSKKNLMGGNHWHVVVGLGVIPQRSQPRGYWTGVDGQGMERVMAVGLWCGHHERIPSPSISQGVHPLQFEMPLPSVLTRIYQSELTYCYHQLVILLLLRGPPAAPAANFALLVCVCGTVSQIMSTSLANWRNMVWSY